MTNKLTLYNPHANQIKIHESKARYRTVVAGRRFGKSALALNEALARTFQLENQIVWIVLPLYRQAKEIYWIDPDITKYYRPYEAQGLIEINRSELSLLVKSTNSWIRLKGSDNFDSLRGAGIDLLIWDEVDDIKQEAFETVEPSLADSPNHRVLYIGTPKGLKHLHDFALRGDHKNVIPDFGKPIKPHRDWRTWHFTSYDNLSFKEGTKERKTFVSFIDERRDEAKEKGKLAWFNQEYMASFEESAGRFWPQWYYSTHAYKGILVPKEKYTIYESMDWGRTAPFSWHAHVVIPVNYEGLIFNRIFTFAELYGTQKAPKEWAREIIDKRKAFRINNDRIEFIAVDPSMFNLLSDGSSSIVDKFNESFEEKIEETFTFERGSRNRVMRWATMDNWMLTAPDGIPYWVITESCPNLLRTIPIMSPDPNNIEDIDTTLEDHAIDDVSYFLPFPKWIDGAGFVPREKEKKKALPYETGKFDGMLEDFEEAEEDDTRDII